MAAGDRRRVPRIAPPRRSRFPQVTYPRGLHRDELDAIAVLRRELDEADPADWFLGDTAGSYRAAARMLETTGSPEFLELSQALYGAPTDRLPGSTLTHLEAADQLLAATDGLADAGLDADPGADIPAEIAAEALRVRLAPFFTRHEVEVVVDPHLASRATAGSRRVRLRGDTHFSELIEQLVEHEAFVHTATALNGREQPVLTILGLGAPRTTLTQEGIATVAELATRAIDITRLRRIALRIRAIDMAIEGADFVQVFRFFLERGQSEEESVRSAMRVYRGGDVRGRWAFTKDVVYLQGLVAVHMFLRKAIATDKPFLVERLFAGRMAMSDVFLLEEVLRRRHDRDADLRPRVGPQPARPRRLPRVHRGRLPHRSRAGRARRRSCPRSTSIDLIETVSR